jgi:CelD/BcsL family acetyltransferase involved in cellulose biosynthesis
MRESVESSSPIRIELITSLGALTPHAKAYHELLDEALPGRAFFYRVESLAALAPVHAAGRRSLFLLFAWRGEQLVGALPLVLDRKSITRAGVRRLQLWGGDGTLLGVEGDVAVRGTFEERAQVVHAWREALTGPLANQFDELELNYLRGDSAVLGALQQSFRDGTWANEPLISHVIDLRMGVAQWKATRSRDRMRRIRSLRRRLEALGTVSIEEHVHLAPERLAQLMALHSARQQSLSERGKHRDVPFADHTQRDALLALLEEAARQGRARHRLLYVGDVLVAFRLAFIESTTMLAWMTAMHDQYAEYSPGSMLLQEVIEREFAAGSLQRIELGIGTTFLKETMATESIVPQRLLWRPPGRPIARARVATWRWLVQMRQRFT